MRCTSGRQLLHSALLRLEYVMARTWRTTSCIDLSTWPFASGRYGNVNILSIPSAFNNSDIILDTKFGPLSDLTYRGHPYRHTTCSSACAIFTEVASRIGTSSVVLVN